MTIVLVMTTVVACIKDDKKSKTKRRETVEGTWEAEIEIGEYLTEMLTSDESFAELADFFELKNCTLVYEMEINDDGTYKLSVDKNSAKDAADDIRKAFKQCMEDYFKDYIEGQNSSMTVDELLEESGISMDDLLDAYMGEDNENYVKLFEEMATEGYWKVEDDKFYTAETEDDFDEDEYDEFELDGDSLTFTDGSGEDAEEMQFIYPMEFTRK